MPRKHCRDLHLCENVSDNSTFVIFRNERDLRPCQAVVEICGELARDPSARNSLWKGLQGRDSHNTSFDSSVRKIKNVVSIALWVVDLSSRRRYDDEQTPAKDGTGELTSGRLCKLQFCIPIKSSIVALRMFILSWRLFRVCS